MPTVITREDFPVKPNPSGLLHLAKINNIDPKDAAYIGDFEFDLQASKNAGMKSGLFLNSKNQYLASQAEFTLSCYHLLLKNL